MPSSEKIRMQPIDGVDHRDRRLLRRRALEENGSRARIGIEHGGQDGVLSRPGVPGVERAAETKQESIVPMRR